MSVADRLAELGLELPPVVAPVGSYVPAVPSGSGGGGPSVGSN